MRGQRAPSYFVGIHNQLQDVPGVVGKDSHSRPRDELSIVLGKIHEMSVISYLRW